MATCKEEVDPLMDSVTCSICMEILDDPRSLPCMHCYCRKCIQDIIDKQEDKKTIPCPICREEFPIPEQGAAGLKVNFFANSVLDAVKDRASTMKVHNCDICLQVDDCVPAVLKCMECNEKLCKRCGHTHKLSRSSRSHKIFELTGDTTTDTTTAINMLSKRTLYCQVHDAEPLKYFCKQDQRLICQDCFAFDHQGHQLENIEQTAKTNLKNLSSVIDLGRQRSEKYDLGIQRAHVVKQDIQKNIEECRAKLDADQKAVQAKTKAHFDALHDKVTTMGNAAIKNTVAHLADLQFDKNAIDGTVKQLQALQEHGHAADIVYTIPEMNNKREIWSTPPGLNKDPPDNIHIEASKITDNDIILAEVKKSDKKTREAVKRITASLSVTQLTKDATKTTTEELTAPPIMENHKIIDNLQRVIALNDDNIAIIIHGDKLTFYDNHLNLKLEKDITGWKGVGTTGTGIAVSFQQGCYPKILYYDANGKEEETIDHLLGLYWFNSPSDFVYTKSGDIIFIGDSKSLYLCRNNRFIAYYTPDDSCDDAQNNNIAINSKDDIILSAEGRIIATKPDYDAKLSLGFSKNSRKLFEFRPEGADEDTLFTCVDKQDNIIVLNKDKHSVKLFSPKGKYIKDLINPDTFRCKVISISQSSQGELLVGALHHGSDTETCVFTFKY